MIPAARVLTISLVIASCGAQPARGPISTAATPAATAPVTATAAPDATSLTTAGAPQIATSTSRAVTATASVPTATASVPPASTAAPSGGPLAALPPCGSDPLFDTLPMSPSDFLAFRPLGWTSPTIHVFPAKHSNFALALPGQAPPVRPVVSPGRVWVTEVNSASYGTTGKVGYGITFYPCRDYKAYFGHLSGISERLLAADRSGQPQCNPPYLTGGTLVTGCRTIVSVELAPGEAVGVSGDAAGVDFGAIDFRIPPLPFAEPRHYCPPVADGTVRFEGCELLHYVSPVTSFRADVRAVLESKIGSYDGTVMRTAAPKHGEYMQDRPGTARGNWFLPGKDLSVPFLQPDEFIALVHEYVDPAQPIISVGTTLRGVTPGVYTFAPRSSGLVDRDFADVRSDGNVYCYEGFRSGRTVGGIGVGDPGGILIVQLPTPTTLRIEKQGTRGARCGSGPWTFTGNATLYNR